MSIVDFGKVKQIFRSSVTPITGGNGAVGPTNDPDRPTLYDPLWGYFIFGQTLSAESGEGDAYQSLTSFSIDGTFTRNAEGLANADDQTAFLTMIAKYEDLKEFLDDAARAEAPADYADWGTENDPRCIPLPLPLVDKDGHRIYALATGIQIERTLVPEEIKYRATLKEAKFPKAKLLVNGILLDGAVLSITPPTPEFVRHKLVGTSGEVLQLQHYKTMEVELAGSLPMNANQRLISDDAASLAAALVTGTMPLTLLVRSSEGVTSTPLFGPLAIVDEPFIEADARQQVHQVSVRMRQ